MMVSRSLFVLPADGWKVRYVWRLKDDTLSTFRRLFHVRVVKQSCWTPASLMANLCGQLTPALCQDGAKIPASFNSQLFRWAAKPPTSFSIALGARSRSRALIATA